MVSYYIRRSWLIVLLFFSISDLPVVREIEIYPEFRAIIYSIGC
jgi:hypothetical protein